MAETIKLFYEIYIKYKGLTKPLNVASFEKVDIGQLKRLLFLLEIGQMLDVSNEIGN